MKFRKVIESGIITAALAVSSVTTAVSASAAEVDTTGVVGSVLSTPRKVRNRTMKTVCFRNWISLNQYTVPVTNS